MDNTDFNKFYLVLNRTPDAYSIDALTFSETAARNVYNRTLEAFKNCCAAGVNADDEAVMLVEVFEDYVSEDTLARFKSFVGTGYIADEGVDFALDDILYKTGSICDVIEYYEQEI